jgi:hypothetical protein
MANSTSEDAGTGNEHPTASGGVAGTAWSKDAARVVVPEPMPGQ